jgi:hypothetical protein
MNFVSIKNNNKIFNKITVYEDNQDHEEYPMQYKQLQVQEYL